MAFSHALTNLSIDIIKSTPATPHDQKWNINQQHSLVFIPSKPGNNDKMHLQHAQILKQARQAISLLRKDTVEELVMIDAVQRLAIDYHFKDEINAVLQRQYKIFISGHEVQDHNLYEIALRFRLLRQQGYNVPPDIFNNFKDNEGKFKQILAEDTIGVMSLYEASQLSMKGEIILDEAEDFSNRLLNTWATDSNHPEASIAWNTLNHPYHKNLARFTAKIFLRNFQTTTSQWRREIQQLAKLSFNVVQSIHQKEILQISQWWSDLYLMEELKLIRNQPLKWYMWPMVMITDPDMSELRVELTKTISFICVIDDIFDVYGTLDELTLFTEVVNRWDYSYVNNLPSYMQTCFKALDDTTTKISEKIYRAHGWDSMQSLRKAWARLCNAFLLEAKWFASGQLPNSKEYLKNGVVSSGVHILLVHVFFFLGQNLTKENVDIMNEGNVGIIRYVATILRLWDDLGSAKDETQDGKDGSYVEIYMEENKSLSLEMTRQHVHQMILDAWKCLNQESLSPNPFSATFINASLNGARMIPFMYDYDENGNLPSLEKHIKSLLYESL